MQNVLLATLATVGTWLLTALGAATVAFFKNPAPRVLSPILGFSAGVMIAASFWSLLEPAAASAELLGMPAYAVTVAGFICGAGFMWVSDKGIARLTGGRGLDRMGMLMLSVTLHNIPEGLAIGVAFGQLCGSEGLGGAFGLALGIGLQNFPEGAAVSLPLRKDGRSRLKSFMLGQASGAVEPIAGALGALLAMNIERTMPFVLSFAAGAMILVSVHELIPSCREGCEGRPYLASAGVIGGFAVMTLLDIMLG